jgi:hypothetical protein
VEYINPEYSSITHMRDDDDAICVAAIKEIDENYNLFKIFLVGRSSTKDWWEKEYWKSRLERYLPYNEKRIWDRLESNKEENIWILKTFFEEPRRWDPFLLLRLIDQRYKNLTEGQFPLYPLDLMKRKQLNKLRALVDIRDSRYKI